MSDEHATPPHPDPSAPAPTPPEPVESAPAEAAVPQRACQNCGAALLGDHCYACGQPVKGLVRHFSSIVGDFVDSVLNFDARTLRTLGPLLLRPGHLSNEYFAGRRIRYVSPVRLFVFLCVVAFFVLQLTIDPASMEGDVNFEDMQTIADVEQMRDARLQKLQKERDKLRERMGPNAPPGAVEAAEAGIITRETLAREAADRRIAWLREREIALRRGQPPPPEPESHDNDLNFNGRPWHPTENPLRAEWAPEWFNGWVNDRIGHMKENLQRIDEDPKLLVDACLQTLPQTLFLLLPLFALLLKLAYLFKRRLYMEHLIVALHSHAFMCLALMLLVGIDELDTLLDGNSVAGIVLGFATFVLGAWIPLYLLLTQKRAYGQGWIMTLLKFAVLGTCYFVLIAFGAAFNVLFNVVAM